MANKSIICPNCQAANPAGARFCAACGTTLAAAQAIPNPLIAPAAQPLNGPAGGTTAAVMPGQTGGLEEQVGLIRRAVLGLFVDDTNYEKQALVEAYRQTLGIERSIKTIIFSCITNNWNYGAEDRAKGIEIALSGSIPGLDTVEDLYRLYAFLSTPDKAKNKHALFVLGVLQTVPQLYQALTTKK